MAGFAIGIISSLVASLIAAAAGWSASRRARRWPLRLLSRLTGLGMIRQYRTQREANADLPAALARARWIRILAGRGNELTRDTFSAVWRNVAARMDVVEILLPDPDTADAVSWVTHREGELSGHDSGYSDGLLADQIRANIRYLRHIASQRSNMHIRLFNMPHVGRIIATDQVVFLTLYRTAEHGRNSPCLAFSSSSPLYDFSLRLFATTWQHAVDARVRPANSAPPTTGHRQTSSNSSPQIRVEPRAE